jgi:hypothetical protein
MVHVQAGSVMHPVWRLHTAPGNSCVGFIQCTSVYLALLAA